jgi:hypothetical protein
MAQEQAPARVRAVEPEPVPEPVLGPVPEREPELVSASGLAPEPG